MSKKQFGATLKASVDQQDASLKKRFEAAESVLLSEQPADLKARAASITPAVTPVAPKPLVPTGEMAVRDTFSMPADEYAVIEKIRNKAAKEGYIYSKSEIVRGALLALNALPQKDVMYRLSTVERIKPGRKT
jgi:hypothetical protein